MEGGGEASVTPTRIFSGVVKVVTKGGRAYMRTIPDEGDVLIPPAVVGCYAGQLQPGATIAVLAREVAVEGKSRWEAIRGCTRGDLEEEARQLALECLHEHAGAGCSVREVARYVRMRPELKEYGLCLSDVLRSDPRERFHIVEDGGTCILYLRGEGKQALAEDCGETMSEGSAACGAGIEEGDDAERVR